MHVHAVLLGETHSLFLHKSRRMRIRTRLLFDLVGLKSSSLKEPLSKVTFVDQYSDGALVLQPRPVGSTIFNHWRLLPQVLFGIRVSLLAGYHCWAVPSPDGRKRKK